MSSQAGDLVFRAPVLSNVISVELSGLEPLTFSMSMKRSNQLSYSSKNSNAPFPAEVRQLTNEGGKPLEL